MIFDIIDMSTVTFLLAGVIAGAIAGFIPGIGNTIALMLLFPVFLGVDDASNIVVFYVAMLSVGQYTGSVTSTVFSVPGELSSLPAVKEGHRLYRRGLGSLSLSGCAMGSTVGSLLSIGFVLYVAQYLHEFTFLYSTKFMSGVLVFVLVFLVFGKYNHWIINLFLCMLGYFLAMLGTNSLNEHQTLTFGIDQLLYGVPMFCVVTWLYVFPEILRNWNTPVPTQSGVTLHKEVKLSQHLSLIVKHWASVARGSVFGFFLGLTPYLTTVIASNVSYGFETWLRKKKKSYDDQGDYASLVASETANNAAALSSLLPLLLLGIPITSSEAILSEIVTANGYFFDIDTFYEFFVKISYCLLVINLLGLCIAWPLSKYFHIFYLLKLKSIYVGVLIFCVFITFYIGIYNHDLLYYICVSVVFAVIGYLLRRIDTMPLVFVFMMQDGIEANLTRLIFYMW